MIAVVGAVRSDTAMTSLPLFNAAASCSSARARGYAGFTAPVAAGEPDRWYPSGRRDLRARDRGRHRGAGPAARRRPREGGDRGRGREGRLRAGGGAAGGRRRPDRGGRSARRRGDLRGQRAASAQGVAESLTREAPSATLVFGDELTRRRTAAPAQPRRPPPRRLRHRRSRAGELRPSSRPAFEEQFGREPDPYAVLTWRATQGVLDALAVAGRRANLRRVVAERFPSPPPRATSPPSGSRDGEREYL